MASNWGNLYNTATANYKALPFNDQAALSGYRFDGMDESGQARWGNANNSDQNIPINSDAGETLDSYVKNNTRFDSQGFFNALGVIPIDPTITNNGEYKDQPRMSPEKAQAWRDGWARSFDKFGFKFNNYDDYLKFTTGPGQYVDDPTLGKVWVPQNRNYQTWNNAAMAASGQAHNPVNAFADSGGLVKLLGGAVLGAGAGDIFNGGLDSFGNVLNNYTGQVPDTSYNSGWDAGYDQNGTYPSGNGGAGSSLPQPPSGGPDVPYDAGENLVNNPETFSNGTPSAGDLLKQGQQIYKTVNGVRQLVDAATGQPVSNSLPQPPNSNTNSDGTQTGLTPAQIAAGGYAAYTLLNGSDPTSLASNNATLQNQIATDAQQQANINFDFYRQNYMPVEAALTHDALNAGSPEMQDQRAAQAGATVTQASANAAKAEQLRKDQMGVRPDSGNAEALGNDRAILTGASVAAAENGARQNERIYGDTMRTSTAGLGRGLQNAGTALANAATNAASASTNGANTTAGLQTNQANQIGALATNVAGMNLGQYFNSATSTPNYDAATKSYDPNVAGSVDGYGTGPTNYGETGPDDFARGGRIVGSYNSDPKTVDASFLPKNRSFIRPPSRTHGYLKGGAVKGPGTGTSDSIPVDIEGRPGRIANGEYVINAKAVKAVGVKKLDDINKKGLPKGAQMKDGVHVAEAANKPATMAAGERATGARYFSLPLRRAA